MEKIIEFKNVSFKYEDEADLVLKNVSLDFYDGQFTCILGHNGSGKSTLAKLMNSLLIPSEGEVLSFGMSTSDENNELDIRKNVGMVFQNPDNQIVATVVEDDVAFGPENLGLSREEIRKRVDEALRITDMTSFRLSEPHKLSGGQKQRVAIAGAIAMRTRCIVLDEPTAMLDPKGRREVLAALKKLNKEMGIAVILVTHFMDETVDADRIVVMNDGVAALDGTPGEVFKNAEYLRKIGLDVPKALELSNELADCGINLGNGILTADDFAREFKKYVSEKKK